MGGGGPTCRSRGRARGTAPAPRTRTARAAPACPGTALKDLWGKYKSDYREFFACIVISTLQRLTKFSSTRT